MNDRNRTESTATVVVDLSGERLHEETSNKHHGKRPTDQNPLNGKVSIYL